MGGTGLPRETHMQHISLTPFGRQPMTRAHLAGAMLAQAPAPVQEADKYALLRDLTSARASFGVTDRDLAVLAALVSFVPGKMLADGAALVVHPSNATLSDRAHGMAESTLRRHLAALVRAGLIARRDSPNGKRYAARGAAGEIAVTFGFDLRPLLVRAPEIAAAGDGARAEALALRRMREAVVIRLRDAAKIVVWAGGNTCLEADIATASRQVRRRLSSGDLTTLLAITDTLLDRAKAMVVVDKTEEMHGSAIQNGRHHQNSTTDSHESEPCKELQEVVDPALPLGLVLKAAPDILLYAPNGIRTWRNLVIAAETVRPYLGISPDGWAEAQRIMGPAVAAIVLAAILQRAAHINRPGGYLRALSARAADGAFSPGPMIMALLRTEEMSAA